IPLSLRDPILLARQISALDNLSKGRFILGVGLGAYREEFEAQNISKKINRGEMFDEALEALIRLLLHNKASFRGKYYYFHEIEIWPKPIQNPLPIYIGGNSLQNVKRAVKYRIGWMPAGLTPEEIQLIISASETHNQLHGDFSNMEIAPQLTVCIAESNEKAIRIYKNSQIYEHDLSLKESTFKSQDVEKEIGARDLIGTVDEIIKRIENYRKLGINHLPALIFINDSIEGVNKSIHLFANEVMPSFI
ncbi:MAG: LLM class flavin-dependent oxidoreductase, partial [Candidatus Jordarchaeaceae archaeon]